MSILYFLLTVMMEEFGSDGKRASENHHIQEPRQKRSCSVLRECEGGSSSVAHSDVPRVCKKMRGADHGEIHVDDKRYASGQHDMGLDGRATRNWFNHMHCGKKVSVCNVVYFSDHVMFTCKSLVIM